ncbi:MAG: MaoC family dehydratase [Pseudomonadota bacterium]
MPLAVENPRDLPELGEIAELSRTIHDADIRAFAALCGDSNPVHLDDEVARRSRFGGRVAHGMLVASLISTVLGTRLPGPGVIYLGQELRFRGPVFPGDTITARVEVIEVQSDKRKVRLRTSCLNQGGETVITGEALVLVDKTEV